MASQQTINLNTWSAKRVIADSNTATYSNALLQTGTAITTDVWILHRTNRNSLYGIKYLYDNSTNGTADKIEFYGGQYDNNSNDIPSAWIQLDTGDCFIGGQLTIEGNIIPNTTYTYTLGSTTNIWFNTYSAWNTLIMPDIDLTDSSNGITDSTNRTVALEAMDSHGYGANSTFGAVQFSAKSNGDTYAVFSTKNYLTNNTTKYAGLYTLLAKDGSGYIQLSTNAITNGTILKCDFNSTENAVTVNGTLTVGYREVTTGPSSLTYSNRITIVPYFHTGGPWYIKSGDDSTNAYLALYYNTTQLMRIKHDGTQMIDWKGNVIGSVTTKGADIVLSTSGTSSDDSGDIVWQYGNGQEKMRIWSNNTYTAKSGPNFRVYKSDGTSLYSGTLVTSDGTGASGTWGISITGNAATATKATQDGSGNTITSTYLKLSGGTMTGALTVTSTGSNRANVNIRSATAVPMDLYLGSNNTNYWSISCRESTDPWLGFYWAGSSAGWALTIRTNKHVEIPVHAYVGGYNNTSYALSTNSFICNSWVRTKGSTGWYNEDYAGGWYMSDAKWIRSHSSKPVLIDIGTNNTYGQGGHRLALGLSGGSHVSLMMKGGDVMYGFCVNNDGNWYFGKRTSKSFESTSGDAYCYYGTNTAILPYTDNAVTCGNSSKRWSAVYGVKVYNAVWNDYAECRQVETEEPGYCVTETISGEMIKTHERLQAGCKVISDTYGTLMGQTDVARTPIAVAGRVLVYPYRNKEEYSLGAAVCSAPGGMVDIMTRNEIMMYPERIIGTVSEIPNYEIWHGGSQDGRDDIQVNGRIWIYVR